MSTTASDADLYQLRSCLLRALKGTLIATKCDILYHHSYLFKERCMGILVKAENT